MCAGAALSLALMLSGVLAAPSLAKASTVTLGPALPAATGNSAGCVTADCAYVNTALPAGVLAKAKSSGTITAWRVQNFDGSARLLILQPRAGGKYSIVHESAEVSKACVSDSAGCFPASTVSTFNTNLTIAAGQRIGIELLKTSACNGATSCPQDGFWSGTVGSAYKATSQFFNSTPPQNARTAPTRSQQTAMLVNASEQLGAKTTKPKPTTHKKPKPKGKGKPKGKHGSHVVDITGTWGVYTGPYTQYDKIVMNKKTGTFSGPGIATNGTGYTWPNRGTVKGSSVHWVFGPYNQLKSYTATCDGTISGNKITGRCSDTFGRSGLGWTMTHA
jgi:hypothetical protein